MIKQIGLVESGGSHPYFNKSSVDLRSRSVIVSLEPNESSYNYKPPFAFCDFYFTTKSIFSNTRSANSIAHFAKKCDSVRVLTFHLRMSYSLTLKARRLSTSHCDAILRKSPTRLHTLSLLARITLIYINGTII